MLGVFAGDTRFVSHYASVDTGDLAVHQQPWRPWIIAQHTPRKDAA